jgi:hypothetical protein
VSCDGSREDRLVPPVESDMCAHGMNEETTPWGMAWRASVIVGLLLLELATATLALATALVPDAGLALCDSAAAASASWASRSGSSIWLWRTGCALGVRPSSK